MKKYYMSVEEHKEVSEKLKAIVGIFESMSPMINKYPKKSKVYKNFWKLYPYQNNKNFVELKCALENDLPFEDKSNYPDYMELTRIYYGGRIKS